MYCKQINKDIIVELSLNEMPEHSFGMMIENNLCTDNNQNVKVVILH